MYQLFLDIVFCIIGSLKNHLCCHKQEFKLVGQLQVPQKNFQKVLNFSFLVE
jgi:hypothetical protein